MKRNGRTEKFNRKIYLVIMGACGNQFFQYAFARHLQEKLSGELIIDYSMVKGHPGLWSGSDNLLADFNTVDYKYESSSEHTWQYRCIALIDWIKYRLGLKTYKRSTYLFYMLCAKLLPVFGIYYSDAFFYNYKLYNRKNIIINGYFESAEYFRDIENLIQMELTPRKGLLEQNKELYSIIQNRPSVCITIKRQDVENADISEVYKYGIDYFYNAANYILDKEPNSVFIIFSDNVEWCKENFHLNGEVYYETPNNPIWEKIRLMSGCKHFIIHNSTFSWWVQHLSQRDGKIVIAPVKWMLRDDAPIDIYEDNWIYMRDDGTIQNTHD